MCIQDRWLDRAENGSWVGLCMGAGVEGVVGRAGVQSCLFFPFGIYMEHCPTSTYKGHNATM